MKYFTGILDARTNAAARSIIIKYDEKVISPDLWERLVLVKNQPAIRESVKEALQSLTRPELE